MRRAGTLLTILLLAAALLGGCKSKPSASEEGAGGVSRQAAGTPELAARPAGAATPAAAPGVTPAAAVPETPSLVSFSSGALVVRKPQEYSDGWSAFWMLDERADTGWATPKGITGNQQMVIELPERTLLSTLEFDTAGVDGGGRAARHVVVEMSDQSHDAGFQRIADLTLADAADNQSFPVSSSVPGRWVRLTVKDNYGSPDYVEIMDFRARGKQLTNTPFPDISGTYDSNYGDMHIRQQGTSVTGCYEHDEGLLNGGIEGRIMKLTWNEAGGQKQGPAMMVFTSDGKQLFGLWWYKGSENGAGSTWTGTKKSSNVGSCPHWKGDVGQEISRDLEQFGKARVYGINFDSDSAQIRDESKPTLDKIVTIMNAKPEWKLVVEGHTDSTSTPQHNQNLSQRRAEAVMAYLQAAGIDGSRLKAVGYGATKPVAPNTTAIGRAQNRRVELTKF